MPASLLTENSINRYLINSPMEPQLVRDANGGITLYVQHESPGEEKEANWLPAPKGPFFMIMRQYWPNLKPWTAPGRHLRRFARCSEAWAAVLRP